MFDAVRPLAAGLVLGIDPGLSRCGYGALRRSGSGVEALAAGVLRTPAEAPLPERLRMLDDELVDLVGELRPSVVAVERVLFQVNVRTALAVGQASGVAFLVAARAGVPVVHYSPNEVKLAVTGSGSADKHQVGAMVARLLGVARLDSPDAADALALALCHLHAGAMRAVATASAAGAGDRLARAVRLATAREPARGTAGPGARLGSGA